MVLNWGKQETAPLLFNNKERCEIKLKDLATEDSPRQDKAVLKDLQGIITLLNLGNADIDNRLTYLKVRKMFKQGTDNLKLDKKKWSKGTH